MKRLFFMQLPCALFMIVCASAVADAQIGPGTLTFYFTHSPTMDIRTPQTECLGLEAYKGYLFPGSTIQSGEAVDWTLFFSCGNVEARYTMRLYTDAERLVDNMLYPKTLDFITWIEFIRTDEGGDWSNPYSVGMASHPIDTIAWGASHGTDIGDMHHNNFPGVTISNSFHWVDWETPWN
jgi:hypothetical protein